MPRVVLSFVLAACSAPTTPSNVIEFPVADSAIGSITTSPLALTPAFSTSIADYYVRCAAGTNTLTVTVDGASQTFDLVENDVISIDNDWVRCLPHDFPQIAVTATGTPTPGYYLVNSGHYVAALDTHGTPVWYEPVSSGGLVDSLAVDTISYMPNAEYPYSFDTTPVFDIHSLEANATTTLVSPDGPTNEHELRLLPNGDYLMFADVLTARETANLVTADSTIADCKIEQLTPDGTMVWSWLGSEHIDPDIESVTVTQNMIGNVLVDDVFHCNSIEIGPNNDLLLSSRHTSAIYDIDIASGKILWKLGGVAYSKDGAALLAIANDPLDGFSLQHDARFLANGDITLFDDHGLDTGNGHARGLELSLDHSSGTATIVFQVPGLADSQYMGSFRRYADGDSVVGWGDVVGDPRVVTELDSTGKDIFDIAFSYDASIDAAPFDSLTYRATKVPLSQLDHDLLRAAAAQ